MSSLQGNTEEVRTLLQEVKDLRAPHLNRVKPVATIAAMRGHAEFLNFALTKRAQSDRSLCLARLAHATNSGFAEPDGQGVLL